MEPPWDSQPLVANAPAQETLETAMEKMMTELDMVGGLDATPSRHVDELGDEHAAAETPALGKVADVSESGDADAAAAKIADLGNGH
eukprot:symbB.v1.2.008771.t1/scaffold549.1/size255684/12